MAKTTKEFLAELGNRVSIDDPTNTVVFSNSVSFPNKVGLGNSSVLGQMSIATSNSSIAGGLFGGVDGSTPYVAFGIGSGPTIVAKYSGTGYNFTLPSNKGSSGQVLSTDGTGTTSWIDSGGGGGSVNTAAQYTWTNNHFFTKGVSFGNTTVAAELSISDGAGVYGGIFAGRGPNPYVAFGIPNGPTLVASASGTAYNFNLPPNKGSAGQFLTTDGNGITSWIDGSSASVNTAAEYTWTNGHIFTKGISLGNNSVLGQMSIATSNSSIAGGLFGGVDGSTPYVAFGIGSGPTLVSTYTGTAYNFYLPPNKGSAGQVLSTDGTGITSWISPSAASVNTAAEYTWTNGHIFTKGISLGSNSVLGQMTIRTGNNTIAGGLFGGVDVSTPYVAFGIGSGPTLVASASGTAYNFYLPPNKGSVGQVLSTDGNGGTSWITPSAASVNTAAQYTWTNTHTFNADIRLDGIIANNTIGAPGQLLASDGTKVYWTTASAASVNTAAQYTWTNTHTFTEAVTLGNNSVLGQMTIRTSNNTISGGLFGGVDGSTPYVAFGIGSGPTLVSTYTGTAYNFYLPPNKGSAGQVLSTDGTGKTSWITTSAGGVNTAAEYTWTNTHTFSQGASFNKGLTSGNNTIAGNISISDGVGVYGGIFAGRGPNPYVAIGIPNGPTLVASASGTAYNFNLPPNKGSAGQVLSTDGNGITSWINAGGGTAPGNKGPITVSTDASWSLNPNVVTDGNLAGSISASKLAGNITSSLLSAGAPTWTTASNLTCSGGLNTASINYNGFLTSSGAFNVFTVNNNQIVGYIRDTGLVIQKPGGSTAFLVNSSTGDVELYNTVRVGFFNQQGNGANGSVSLWKGNGTSPNWTAINDNGAFKTGGPVNVVVNSDLIASQAVNNTDIMSKVRDLNAIYLDHVGMRSMAVGVDALKAHFPELVSDFTYESEKEGTIKHDTVDLLGLISVLLESVKNLDARIQELEPKKIKK